ncbi:conserved hypothetical protein [Uncinocarpus reesii 1704]|uniref:Ubiquitin-like protease family profile domain-containing protein n=1 Tax=Uncinocarpus reesii (strain UAMH 1704) TaxID=336963 RepID=C4JZZ5_UNCRE|nr:uncharacterized protein UREG_07746 [Uncinocarpus reesii 1704]EEP82881.1 conserved hypothetical protein [Uncinocarpus reesii 1704]
MGFERLLGCVRRLFCADLTQASPDDTYLTYHDISLTNEDVDTLKNDWLTDNVGANGSAHSVSQANMFKTGQVPRARSHFTISNHQHHPPTTHLTEAEGGTHWSLLLVSVVDGVAFHYDSLPPGNRNEALRVAQKVSMILDRGFRFVQLDDSPVQENSSDCGVFVCLTMRHLLINRLLKACTSEKVSMSLGGKKVNASAGRREMVRIIDRFRKKKDHKSSRKWEPADSAQEDCTKTYNVDLQRLHNQCQHSRRTYSRSPISFQNGLKQNRIPAAYYRGGTSRGVIFQTKDLPLARADWAPIFLGVMGSPDSNGRQLDGLGGGISSLSKICVVGPSDRPGIDVEFTFVQVGVKSTDIDYSGNCGNLSSAIGPFAVDSGIIRPTCEYGDVTVRIYNTNTDKVIEATFPVHGGEALAHGDFAIDGVAGTAAKVKLDFIKPSGSKTGKMLPTGNVVDYFDGIRTTCVDVGNPSVFVSAEELGVSGTILPDETQNVPGLLDRLESIRQQATMKMGMASTPREVPASIPKICFVSQPSSHSLLSGEILDGDSVDVVVRAISVGQPHRALPITTSLSLAVAAKIQGSVVNQLVRASVEDKEELVIGHSSGKLVVGASIKADGEVEKASVYRTARRLMDGIIYWK